MKDPNRDLAQRPALRPWLSDEAFPPIDASSGRKRSYHYWRQIHFATPPWATKAMWAEMKRLYESADPAYQQLDHIVPLKHPLVCGLNVPWNMEVVSIRENQLKSNHYWPDCPDHLCPVKNANKNLFDLDLEPHQLGLAL